MLGDSDRIRAIRGKLLGIAWDIEMQVWDVEIWKAGRERGWGYPDGSRVIRGRSLGIALELRKRKQGLGIRIVFASFAGNFWGSLWKSGTQDEEARPGDSERIRAIRGQIGFVGLGLNSGSGKQGCGNQESWKRTGRLSLFGSYPLYPRENHGKSLWNSGRGD